MHRFVAYNSTSVQPLVEFHVNDRTICSGVGFHSMKHAAPSTTVSKIHQDKAPRRKHFIKEWIERRDMKQADVVRGMGVDKGAVSRWCAGYMPGDKNLEPLIKFLQLENPIDLFHHPDQIWIWRFLEGRSEIETAHIQKSLEVIFPKKNGTDG